MKINLISSFWNIQQVEIGIVTKDGAKILEPVTFAGNWDIAKTNTLIFCYCFQTVFKNVDFDTIFRQYFWRGGLRMF